MKRVGPALLMCTLAACGGGGDGGRADRVPEHKQHCAAATFTPPAQSPYRLPYGVGTTQRMFQGNCPDDPRWGHASKLAYDFETPMGTPVLAARDGVVSFVREHHVDTDQTPGNENFVHVTHADGTVGRYIHLRNQGAEVVVGQAVIAGDLLGFSGNTGGSDRPHLHFEVVRDATSFEKRDTLPVTFRNAEGEVAANGELLQDRSYRALP